MNFHKKKTLKNDLKIFLKLNIFPVTMNPLRAPNIQQISFMISSKKQ